MGRLRDGREQFPLLHVLLQIIDVLPRETTTVERGFSLLNRLKDKTLAECVKSRQIFSNLPALLSLQY